MKPFLTVIIPIYNIQEVFLKRCINSVIHQTIKEIEIILVNDGSTEINRDICDEYAKIDSRIVVLHQENKGVSVARNRGIEVSKAEWIMFVDADDYLEPHICKKAYNKALEYDADIVQFGYAYNSQECIDNISDEIFGDGREVLLAAKEYRRKFIENILHVNKDIRPMYLSVPWGKIYKKKLIQNNKIEFVPGLARMQDMIFNAYVFQHTRNLLYIDDVGYYYNRTTNSVTVKYNPNAGSTFTFVFKKLLLFLQNHYPNKEDSYLKLSMGYLLLIDSLKLQILHKENEASFFQKRKSIKEIFSNSTFDSLFADTTTAFIKSKRKSYYLLYFKLYSLIIIFKNKLL